MEALNWIGVTEVIRIEVATVLSEVPIGVMAETRIEVATVLSGKAVSPEVPIMRFPEILGAMVIALSVAVWDGVL